MFLMTPLANSQNLDYVTKNIDTICVEFFNSDSQNCIECMNWINGVPNQYKILCFLIFKG